MPTAKAVLTRIFDRTMRIANLILLLFWMDWSHADSSRAASRFSSDKAPIETASWSAAGPRLIFVGDILLSRNVVKERNRLRVGPWWALDSLFRNADWTMGNLEGAVGASGDCPETPAGKSPDPCFAIPDSLIVDLKQAGFTALSLANNHAMDLGSKGRNRSIRALVANGMDPIGFGESPFYRNIGGHTVAFISLSLIAGKDGKRQQVPDAGLSRKFRMARNFADWIVVFAHWGTELQDWPDAGQIKAAHWLVEQGADLIMGAHPHVVQAPACVEGKPVFYSLGNHLFDQKYPQTRQGLIADCRLGPEGFTCRPRWTAASSQGYQPVLKEGPDSIGAPITCSTDVEARGRAGSLTLESRWSGDSVKHRWKQRWVGKVGGGGIGRSSWDSRASKLLSASPFTLRDKPGRDYLFSLENHFSSLDKEVAPRPYVYEITATGPIARWRGSALAWPLLDAAMLPGNVDGILCALHRRDSFLALDPGNAGTRMAAYRWNGFGFAMLSDTLHSQSCRAVLR